MWSISLSVAHAQSQPLLEQKHTLNIPPTPLIEALGLIRAQTGIRFTYSPSNLPVDQLVQVSADNQTVAYILELLFEPLNIQYQQLGNQIALRPRKTVRKAYSQTIRGQVFDADTQTPLVGATVVIQSLSPIRGATTDINGFFEIPDLPIGRHTLQTHFLGYQKTTISEIQLTAGKEVVLDLALKLSTLSLDPVIVSEEVKLDQPFNEMALVSARSFALSETQRYPGSLADPARMVQAFAGVSRSEDDILNEVIVRGQSPKYTRWRLEGIEIPNPNHFGDGQTSGGINMLSADLLANSDFLSGSFPAEYGNALAGVFDVHLRKGNTSKSEISLELRAAGLEGTFEGPFSKTYNGSYLVNYRYSMLGLLSQLEFLTADNLHFSDLAFKFHFPTPKAGTFNLFGVMGQSSEYEIASRDTSRWENDPFVNDADDEDKKGVVGLSHTLVLSSNSYLKTVLAGFGRDQLDLIFRIYPNDLSQRLEVDEERFHEKGIRGHMVLNHRINPRHLLQIGLTGTLIDVKYRFRNRSHYVWGPWDILLDAKESLLTVQSFGQWSYRPADKWTINTGIHSTYFELNGETTFEPRLNVQWQLTADKSVSVGSSLHSQAEPWGVYLLTQTEEGTPISNRNLRLTKAWHNVVAYDQKLTPNTRLKTELYYNRGYDIPVSLSSSFPFSIVNAYDLYNIFSFTRGLANKGTTDNYGVDLTWERFFNNGYYFLITGSLFKALHSTPTTHNLPTRYDTRFMINALGGIEHRFGRHNKHVFAFNTRFLIGGGNRHLPIDLEQSVQLNRTIYLSSDFSGQLPPYYRIDLGIDVKVNKSFLTHTFFMDVQNAFVRKNEGFVEYNPRLQKIEKQPLLGILPIAGYQLTF